MTRGTALPRARPCCRATPASSTAVACGPSTFTTASRVVCTMQASRRWRTPSVQPSSASRRKSPDSLGVSGTFTFPYLRCGPSSRSSLLLLIRAVNHGAGDRIHEQIEAEVGRAGVPVEFELLDLDGMHRNEIPVETVPRWRGGADEALEAGVVGQSDRIAW